MSDNEKSNSSGGGCFSSILVLIVIGLSLAVGPLDAYRTVYNCVLGDIPVLKGEMLNYSRAQIGEQYSNLDKDLVEEVLASRLQLSIKNKQIISPDMVSILELWDLVEVYPRSWKDKWIWTRLNTVSINEEPKGL